MTLQKLINLIFNYYIFKFNLKFDFQRAFPFEEASLKWNELYESTLIIKNRNKNSKNFTAFIKDFKKLKTLLENRNDISLYNNLLNFLFLVRRISNKQKNFAQILNLKIKDCLVHPEFGKTKLLNTAKIISIKYPKKKAVGQNL